MTSTLDLGIHDRDGHRYVTVLGLEMEVDELDPADIPTTVLLIVKLERPDERPGLLISSSSGDYATERGLIEWARDMIILEPGDPL